MVNRKKSPIVDIEQKTALKNSKEDENADENPAKRQRRDSGAKQRLCFSSELGLQGDCQDLDEQAAGHSDSANGFELSIEQTTEAEVGRDSDGSKDNQLNLAPVVSHQIATRSVTGRLSRRLRSYSPPKSPPPINRKSAAKEGQKSATNSSSTSNGTPETKTRKQWGQWSVQDKDMFFEALYEHGKDFEAIQNTISLKLKKKDPTCGVRTKDHIRHFYYRTWHKISKFIDLEGFDDINKQALELYGLINYGELHKWIGKLNGKTGQKLNELVHKGVTVVKVKQKNHRIKTPVCRALKRLHHVEEHKEEEKTKMPERIIVELFPHTNSAWAEVQAMAQNPRLRIHLRISKRISSLVDFMNKKWTTDRVRMKERLSEPENPENEIKIHVPDTTKLSPLQVRQAPTAPKLEFSFDSYVESVKGQLNTSPQQAKKPAKTILGKLESLQIQQPCTSFQDQLELTDHVQDNQVSSTDEVSASADNFGLSTIVDTSPDRPKDINPESPVPCEHLETVCIDQFDESAIPFSDILPDEKSRQDEQNLDDTSSNPCTIQVKTESKSLSCEELEAKEKLAKLERGFTAAECGSMTIAEIYMMTGCPKKLCLEYEWVEKKAAKDIWELNKKLTNMLRRLVHLATTEFIDFKKTRPPSVPQLSRSPCRCTCGASRNDHTPPNSKLTSGRSGRINSPASSKLKTIGKTPTTPTNSLKHEALQLGLTKQEALTSSANPVTPPSSKCQLVMTSPSEREEGAVVTVANVTAVDGVFKLPTAMPPRVQQIRPVPPGSLAEKNQLLHQISMVQKQSEFYTTKRPGQRRLQRVVRRPLVVQRTLLPKAQVPTRQIMTLAMVPGVSAAGQTASFLPIMSSSVLKPGDTVLQTSSAALHNDMTPTSGIGEVAVSQVFGIMQTTTTTTRSTPTTVSATTTSKPAPVRRIVPTPVTSGSESSAVFVEAPEFGGINNNILKKAALAADIQDPLSPVLGVATRQEAELHTPPHEQVNFTSGSGSEHLESPSTFSQAFSISGVDAILHESSISSDSTVQVTTITDSQPSTSLVPEQPNVSALLDITLPSVSDMTDCSDKLLDISLMNSDSSFGGLVGDKEASLSSLLNSGDNSGTLSPTKPFKSITSLSSEEQWLGTGDISMSNLLQDTPLKKPSVDLMLPVTMPVTTTENKQPLDISNGHPASTQSQPFALGESSRDSVILKNVDTTFEVMMNENSMDYMSKFADLAAHINGTHQENSALRKQAELVRDKT